MGILFKVFLAVVAAAAAVNCAVAAPAAPAAPRILDYSFSGNGCKGGAAELATEPGKLVIQIPEFSSAMAPSTSCQGHYSFADGIPGYKLAVKSVSAEGYLYSSGSVHIATSTTLFWSEDAANTFTAQSNYTTDDEMARLQMYHETTEVPVEYASGCLDSADSNVGVLNINWRVRVTPVTDDSHGTFLGMEGSSVKEVIEFVWVPCDAPTVDIETGKENK